jgi:hypothetical protein
MNVRFTFNATEIFLEPTTLKGHDLFQKLALVIDGYRWIKKGRYGLLGIPAPSIKESRPTVRAKRPAQQRKAKTTLPRLKYGWEL